MPQTAQTLRPGLLRLALLVALCGYTVLATAQLLPQDQLMMQGPTQKRSLRFNIGETIVVRFRGEDEFFPLVINALYLDANAMLLGENLIKLTDLAAIRYENRKRLKDYLRAQGLVMAATVGLVALLDAESRERQAGFMLGAAGVGGAMVLYGSTRRYNTRLLGNGKPYFLVILGEVRPVKDVKRP